MKRLLVVIASSFFAVGASAADIYGPLGDDNPELSTQRLSAEDFAGVQPSIGDSAASYYGWVEGESNLFKPDRTGQTDSGDKPDIYNGFSGGDLQY